MIETKQTLQIWNMFKNNSVLAYHSFCPNQQTGQAQYFSGDLCFARAPKCECVANRYFTQNIWLQDSPGLILILLGTQVSLHVRLVHCCQRYRQINKTVKQLLYLQICSYIYAEGDSQSHRRYSWAGYLDLISLDLNPFDLRQFDLNEASWFISHV